MSETLRLKARSVSISDDGADVSVSMVTDKGEHVLVTFEPLHWALIGQHASGYAMEWMRKFVRKSVSR